MNNPRTLALSHEAVPIFPARPFRIVTLLDMLQFYAYVFYLFINKFDVMACDLQVWINKRGMNSEMEPEELGAVRFEMTELQAELEKAGVAVSLETTARRMEEIRETCNDDYPPPVLGEVAKQIRRLRTDLERDLKQKIFMSLSEAEVRYWERPELFGFEVKAKFPKANEEITAAGTCFAINDYDGCVYHLMRAVEYGARAMLKQLGVQKYGNHPIELCDWGGLKRALEAELPKLSTGKLTDIQIMSDFQWYSYAIQEFDKFIVWRNKASHLRETYSPGQTKDLIEAVERYMRHLAERLDEVGLKV